MQHHECKEALATSTSTIPSIYGIPKKGPSIIQRMRTQEYLLRPLGFTGVPRM
eukprot:m.41993 g.41993  ORF g.41993 m.41993 type:complete len:53 (+) comp9831_c0_seq1:165-323(+)